MPQRLRKTAQVGGLAYDARLQNDRRSSLIETENVVSDVSRLQQSRMQADSRRHVALNDRPKHMVGLT